MMITVTKSSVWFGVMNRVEVDKLRICSEYKRSRQAAGEVFPPTSPRRMGQDQRSDEGIVCFVVRIKAHMCKRE